METGLAIKRAEKSPGPSSLSAFRYSDLAKPTPRVALAIERNQSAVPELFPHRAVAATRGFLETEGQPLALRKARMIERILREHPVRIQDGEMIIGMKTLKPRGSPVFPEINCSWVERDLDIMATRPNTPFFVAEETKRILRKEVFPYWRGRQMYDRIMEAVPPEIWHAEERGVIYNYFTSRTIGHFAADYEKVLSQGMIGVMAEVDASLRKLHFEDPRYIHKKQFLESLLIVCRAASEFAFRHAAEARRLASLEKDPGRRSELEKTAAICSRVPAEPARDFREALQSFWFVHLILNLETSGHSISPGRFDQYMYPYLNLSLDSGGMNRDEAQELLDLVWVKLDEITLAKNSGESDTSSSYPDFQQLNIGGFGPDGQDATNDLSFMCLDALERTKLPQPQLSAQVSTKTPPKFLRRCSEVIRYGMGMPALFNSDLIVLGMVNRGKSLADARRGSINGCVSPYCDGRDRAASTGYFNLAKTFELAMNDGRDRQTGEQLGPKTGEANSFPTFESFINAFKAQITHFVSMKVKYDNIVRDLYAAYCPVPFTSALMEDCIGKAVDWHQGGARYNQAVMSGVGVGTVADSFSAVKKHIFEDKKYSLAELNKALDEDFRGHEAVLRNLLDHTPHYGNDNDEADSLALLGQDLFCGEVEKHRDIQGARYFVDLLPTTAHIALGRLTGATPDGRRSGHWLSEGVSPVQGHDRNGPTSAAKSVAKLDHARCNGTLFNLKFNPQCLRTDGDIQKLADLIRGYFDLGGFHVQINIIDQETLREAQKFPENYRNLIVRVAGYSDYFVLLSRDIQEEIISRTEHGL